MIVVKLTLAGRGGAEEEQREHRGGKSRQGNEGKPRVARGRKYFSSCRRGKGPYVSPLYYGGLRRVSYLLTFVDIEAGWMKKRKRPCIPSFLFFSLCLSLSFSSLAPYLEAETRAGGGAVETTAKKRREKGRREKREEKNTFAQRRAGRLFPGFHVFSLVIMQNNERVVKRHGRATNNYNSRNVRGINARVYV